MSERYLIEALNDSLDRLAEGQTIEDCLRAHPDVAQELRILLETGRASSRARADRAEMQAVRPGLDTRFDALLEETEFRKPLFVLPQGAAVMLVASLLLVMVGLFILLPRDDSQPANVVPPTNSPEATENVVFTAMPTITVSATETATPTSSDTPTATNTASATASPTASRTATATASSSVEPATCLINPPDNWVQYRVRAGDTLSALAAASGVSINELMQVNCLEDTMIREGQLLYTPASIRSVISGTDAVDTQASGDNQAPAPTVSGQEEEHQDDGEHSDDDSHEEDRSGSNSGSG